MIQLQTTFNIFAHTVMGFFLVYLFFRFAKPVSQILFVLVTDSLREYAQEKEEPTRRLSQTGSQTS